MREKGTSTKESITKIKDRKKNNCYRNQAADWIKITNCIKSNKKEKEKMKRSRNNTKGM